MTLSVISDKRRHLIIDEHAVQLLHLQPDFAWFSPRFWQGMDAVVATATGRGTTYFVESAEHTLVLRHYRRGGMVRHLSKDRFFYAGIKQTRPWQELSLLHTMNQCHLNVPMGIAGLVTRTASHYQADILTLCIPRSSDMHGLLCKQAIDGAQWRSIGREIKRLHDAQVYHSDLNIHNILLDDQKCVWIIDFDKCQVQKGEKWKNGTLERLKRSLHKETQRCPTYYFTDHDWQALMDGYNGNI